MLLKLCVRKELCSYLLVQSLDSLATKPTRLNTSLMSAPLILRSRGLLHAMEGDMLISSSQGLSASSIRMS